MMTRFSNLGSLMASSVITTPVALNLPALLHSTLPPATFQSTTFEAVTISVPIATASSSVLTNVTTATSVTISTLIETVTDSISIATSPITSVRTSTIIELVIIAVTGAASSVMASTIIGTSAATTTSPRTTTMTTMIERRGRPFAPQIAEIGGIPTKSLDIPVTAIFLMLFIIGAVIHFRIHSINGKMGHKFNLSTAMFDFCMVRNVTCILRIAWATAPNNVSLELAALIFEFAGTVVVFLVNLFFAQRIMRACHGNFGYHPVLNKALLVLMVSVPAIIVYNITILTLSFFTTNRNTLDTLHDFQLFGSSYTLFLAFFPILFIVLGIWIPGSRPVEKFGTGRFRNKVAILLYSSATLSVGSVVRLVAAAIEVPKDHPAWFDGKAVFYITGFTLEILVVYLYIFARVDKRFHVPDGSSKAGDYAKGYPQYGWPRRSLPRWNSFDSEIEFARDASGIDGLGANDGQTSLQEVKAAIANIALTRGVVAYPVDMGQDLLLCAFRKTTIPRRHMMSKAPTVPTPKSSPPPMPPLPATWLAQP